MMTEPIPRPSEALRAAIKSEMHPVQPLPAPWKRILMLSPVLVGILAMPFVYYQAREVGDLGVILSWIPVAIQVVLACGLLMIALREGIPGWQMSATSVFALVLAAYGLQILVNLLIFLRAPLDSGGIGAISMWVGCFRIETLLGIPILVLVAWLVSRALPSRPLLAGFLAGTGAGFAAEASWRMICPYSDPGHVLVAHTGGILVLGVTGFLLGYVWSAFRRPAAGV
jgi:hypothetical protein